MKFYFPDTFLKVILSAEANILRHEGNYAYFCIYDVWSLFLPMDNHQYKGMFIPYKLKHRRITNLFNS